MNRKLRKLPADPPKLEKLPGLWSERKPLLERYFEDRKFNRIHKIYVYCCIHEGVVKRKTGKPAPEEVRDFMNLYERSHSYCIPCSEGTTISGLIFEDKEKRAILFELSKISKKRNGNGRN